MKAMGADEALLTRLIRSLAPHMEKVIVGFKLIAKAVSTGGAGLRSWDLAEFRRSS
jgi:hypothetical protein